MTEVRLGESEPARPRSLLKRPATPGLALAIIASIAALRLWVVETAIVEGESMEPALRTNDRVLIVQVLPPRRFDIVLLTDPHTGTPSIKRLIGLPGDTIGMLPPPEAGPRPRFRFVETQLQINGRPVEEPYVSSGTPDVVLPFTLGEDEYFVLGDNRAVSVDSTRYGPVKANHIRGVGVAVLYPPGRVHLIRRPEVPVPPPRRGPR